VNIFLKKVEKMRRSKISTRNNDRKVLSLFNPNMLELLKKKKFNGFLRVVWKNGDVTLCKLSSVFQYRLFKREDDDGDVVWFDDEFF
jgi:hypothetical protein